MNFIDFHVIISLTNLRAGDVLFCLYKLSSKRIFLEVDNAKNKFI